MTVCNWIVFFTNISLIFSSNNKIPIIALLTVIRGSRESLTISNIPYSTNLINIIIVESINTLKTRMIERIDCRITISFTVQKFRKTFFQITSNNISNIVYCLTRDTIVSSRIVLQTQIWQDCSSIASIRSDSFIQKSRLKTLQTNSLSSSTIVSQTAFYRSNSLTSVIRQEEEIQALLTDFFRRILKTVRNGLFWNFNTFIVSEEISSIAVTTNVISGKRGTVGYCFCQTVVLRLNLQVQKWLYSRDQQRLCLYQISIWNINIVERSHKLSSRNSHIIIFFNKTCLTLRTTNSGKCLTTGVCGVRYAGGRVYSEGIAIRALCAFFVLWVNLTIGNLIICSNRSTFFGWVKSGIANSTNNTSIRKSVKKTLWKNIPFWNSSTVFFVFLFVEACLADQTVPIQINSLTIKQTWLDTSSSL